MTHADAIVRLRDAYPREEFPDRTVALYAGTLSAFTPELLMRAINVAISRNKFRPSLSTILEEIAELDLNLPTYEEAWRIAEKGSLRDAPSAVRLAVEYVGGRWEILHGSNLSVIRAQFRDAYRSLREQAIRDYISPRPVTTIGVGVYEEIGPTMRSLPESTVAPAPPVVARWLRRLAGRLMESPTEDEKRDSVRVLKQGPPLQGEPDPIYLEAERIFQEGGVDHEPA